MWDIDTGTYVSDFEGHTEGVRSIDISPNNEAFVSGSLDGTVRIWNVRNGDWIALVLETETREWLVFDSEGYWDSSPHGSKMAKVVKGLEIWDLEETAEDYHRPDMLLNKLNSIATQR